MTDRSPHMKAAMVAVEILHGTGEWPPEFKNLATQYLDLVSARVWEEEWPAVLRKAIGFCEHCEMKPCACADES